MRIKFRSTARPKTTAKMLKRHAEAIGLTIKLGTAQHITAQIYGYRNWNDMHASIGISPPSEWDDDVDPAVAESRKQYQAEVVASALGLDPTIAGALIAMVGPTARNPSFAARGGVPLPRSDRLSNQHSQVAVPRREAVIVTKTTRKVLHKPTGTVRVFDLTASPSKSPNLNDTGEE